MTINILGTNYTVEIKSESQDIKILEMDGYCDKTTKRIVVAEKSLNCDLGDFEAYQKKVMRHEIIHAFLFESGLSENFTHQSGHDETYVDWIAYQFPKIQAAFEEAGAL